MQDIQDIRINAQGFGVAQHGTDNQVIVEFYDGEVVDHEATAKAGREIYKAAPFIRMMFPGDKTKVVERPVKMTRDAQSPADTERWPKHWERFQAGQHQQFDGMPLSNWPGCNRADVKNLNGVNVFTVEQLAQVNDSNLAFLGHGALDLRTKAQAYVAQFGDVTAANEIKQKLDSYEATILQLQQRVEAAEARAAKQDKKAA